MRPSLARVLHELLGEIRDSSLAHSLALHPARVATLRLPARAPRSDRLAAAERELARVHLAELAFLLREASRLRREGGRPQQVRACCEGLAEALDCARRDGAQLGGRWVALARACVDRPCSAWPRASSLAAASLEMEPCEAGRAALARALLDQGDSLGASRALAAAVLTCPSARRGAGLLEELARVVEGRGCSGRARALRGWAAVVAEVA
jgi:hypothetical protein